MRNLGLWILGWGFLFRDFALRFWSCGFAVSGFWGGFLS